MLTLFPSQWPLPSTDLRRVDVPNLQNGHQKQRHALAGHGHVFGMHLLRLRVVVADKPAEPHWQQPTRVRLLGDEAIQPVVEYIRFWRAKRDWVLEPRFWISSQPDLYVAGGEESRYSVKKEGSACNKIAREEIKYHKT